MLVPDVKNEPLDCKHYSRTTIKKSECKNSHRWHKDNFDM